jgi:hypothetical protein
MMKSIAFMIHYIREQAGLSGLSPFTSYIGCTTPLQQQHAVVPTLPLDRRSGCAGVVYGTELPPSYHPRPLLGNDAEVSSFAAGATNLAIMSGSPSATTDGSTSNMQEAFSTFTTNWNESVNSLQVLYPKGSNAPRNDPQGGTEFYAQPLDLTAANNVSLQYTVYFPPDFDFVKGGKLPGLYGGHKGCSGGNAAAE